MPNFLSVTFDDLNAFAFLKGLYGGQLLTPNIDRVMAMGTTFENAFAQVAVCNASRTSALSGLNPGITGVHDNYQLWSDHVTPALTLPGLLNGAGFSTSLIGKVFHDTEMAPEVEAAVADFRYRPGTEQAAGNHPIDYGPSALPLEQQTDWLSSEQAIARLDAAGDDPFAMFLGLVRPHLDWVVPQEYLDLYPVEDIVLPFTLDGDLSDVPEFMRSLVFDDLQQEVLDAGVWQAALQGYFASITFADAMLGRVLDAMEANGQLDDTMILLWTDHGYHLGDKDNWQKFTLWEEAARAPFVLALPGAADDGQRVAQPVELVDMMPTVLDLMGLAAPEGLSGRSLRAFIDDPSFTDDGVAITTMYGSASIRSGEWRYIRYEDGSTELYDLANDPNEWHNLAGDPGYAALQGSLDARLRDELEADGWHWVDTGEFALGGNRADLFVLAADTRFAWGGDGNDTYFLSDPDANLFARMRSTTGAPALTGNALDNRIEGNGILQGMAGDDLLRITLGSGEADGGAGNDRIAAGNGRDILAGGDGNDTIAASGGNDVLDGGAGDDSLRGDNGNDRLAGGADADTLNGGNGIDTVNGDDGDDTLNGSAGNDVLGGGNGTDTLSGSDGDDGLDGGAGDDLLRGGAGNDRYYVDSQLDRIVELVGGGVNDRVYASVDYQLGTNAEVETLATADAAGTAPLSLIGNGFANLIVGNAGANAMLAGLGGNDTLFGGGGRDTLDGGDGADLLYGGLDSDTLIGGTGRDVFQFRDEDQGIAGPQTDTIADFSRADAEKIQLNLIDADTAADGNQAFAFIGTAGFGGVAGQLRYGFGQDQTWIEADTDGDGVADFSIMLVGLLELEVRDFVL